MTTALEYLFRREAPWIYVGFGESERTKWIPTHFYSRSDSKVCVRRLRGNKMRTRKSLMDEFGASLQFFEEFGENWHALGECLEYLDEWLPASAYVVVIESAEEVLIDEEPDQMVALLKTLHDAGEWWAQPTTDNVRFNRCAVPFHVLFNFVRGDTIAVERTLRVAGEARVPVRS
jgi:Barstar (barnase inhibitor)